MQYISLMECFKTLNDLKEDVPNERLSEELTLFVLLFYSVGQVTTI